MTTTPPSDQTSTPAPGSSLKRRHIAISISLAVVAVCFIGLLAYGLAYIDQKKLPPVNIDKPALPFTVSFVQGQEHLPQSNKEQFQLADIKGKPVVLNFWASWCVSCREEAQELEAFWRQHQSDVLVIGIAIQDEKDSATKFAKYYGKTYTIGLDETGKAAIDYGVSGVPETFLIDRDGIIRHKEIGPVTAASLEKLLPKIQ